MTIAFATVKEEEESTASDSEEKRREEEEREEKSKPAKYKQVTTLGWPLVMCTVVTGG